MAYVVNRHLSDTYTGRALLEPRRIKYSFQTFSKIGWEQMMGIWFLSSALGNLIAGLIAGNIHEVDDTQPPVAIVESVEMPALTAPPTADIMQKEGTVITQQASPIEVQKKSQGVLISEQFMKIVWFALGVAALLFILSGRVRKVTGEIE